jgi:hypothetical protein
LGNSHVAWSFVDKISSEVFVSFFVTLLLCELVMMLFHKLLFVAAMEEIKVSKN